MKLEKKQLHILYLAAGIFFLIPVLFYPIGNDQAIFMMGGKVVSQGGLIGVDYIDIKPPLFYYIFALQGFLFGFTELGFRIFDFLIQSLTLVFLYKTVFRYTANDHKAGLSVIAYTFLYVSLGFNQHITPGSFMGLFILGIINLHYQKGVLALILKAIITGLTAMLKYSFPLIALAIIIDEIIIKRKKYISRIVLFTAFVLISAFATLLPVLFNQEAFTGFLHIIEWTAGYAAILEFNKENLIHLYDRFLLFWSNEFSIPFTFLLVYMLIYMINNQLEERRFLNLLAMISFCLLLTIIFERRFFPYHFLRLYLPVSIMASIALYNLYKNIINIKSIIPYYRIIVLSLLILLAVYAPLSSFLYNYRFAYTELSGSEPPKDVFDLKSRQITLKTAEYIRDKSNEDDCIILMSIGGVWLNLYLQDHDLTAFPQSCFYFGHKPIPEWEEKIFEEIKKADWLVVSKVDLHPTINNHWNTTYESLSESSMMDYIKDNFVRRHENEEYLLYQRKSQS